MNDRGPFMPKSKYESIYQTIKDEILAGSYVSGDLLPSENEYTKRFGCTRNTIRRALAMLTQEGFLLPRHGRGVQVIWQPQKGRSIFSLGGIESLREAADRNQVSMKTRVVRFEERICDEKLSELTGFDVGEHLLFVERVRKINGEAIILDTNYFLKSETEGLTAEIAEHSIYRYLEEVRGMNITTSLRRVTAEKAVKRDYRYLDLQEYDFLLVITGQVFNSSGVMFEYTQSRHLPEYFCFMDTAVRQKN